MPRIAGMAPPEFTCTARVQFLPDRSDPDQDEYAFAYTVTIVNTGGVTAQLIARHWIIRDGRGHTEEVKGLAVVGHQPLLAPGERFEYSSWTRLPTPQGTMRGSFQCMTEHAEPFDAPVPEFALVRPEHLH
jgi:ApaG protein